MALARPYGVALIPCVYPITRIADCQVVRENNSIDVWQYRWTASPSLALRNPREGECRRLREQMDTDLSPRGVVEKLLRHDRNVARVTHG